jgi:hypothetical protein
MQINKPHAAGESGDRIGELVFAADVALLLFASFPQSLDVFAERRSQLAVVRTIISLS